MEHREPLTFNVGNPVTESVERVTVDGVSTVHKTIRSGGDAGNSGYPPGDLPADLNYWRREALVYRSDLREWLTPHGIEMPQLLGELDEGRRVTLVLEDIDGIAGTAADDDALVTLARSWGATQAALVDRPTENWLGADFMRNYLRHRPDEGRAFDDDGAWTHPAVAAVIDVPLRDGLRRLWHDRWWCCDQLKRVPLTLGHHDLWPGNVIFRPNGTPVVLDWAFCGSSAFGLDMVVMILDTFFDLLIDVARLDFLESAMTGAWLDGVSARVDPEMARLGLWLSAARFSWLPVRAIEHVRNGPLPSPYQEDGVTTEQQMAAWAPVFERMVEWHESARAALA